MQVEIIQSGRVLRSINHQSQVYVEAPLEGTYSVRLRNTSHKRQLVVLSVDGVNVVNGEDAGFHGPGYVLSPWQTTDIPGWRRTDGEVAAFRFKESEGSYAAQTGRGANNVGVIGVAVYDEKVKPQVIRPLVTHEHHHHHWPWYPSSPDGIATLGGGNTVRGSNSGDTIPTYGTTTCSTGESQATGETAVDECAPARASFKDSMKFEPERSARGATKGVSNDSSMRRSVRTQSVGTGYGEAKTFHTATTEFERATETPAFVLSLRYGTRDQLIAWGVPLDAPQATMPNPFPVSQPSVPAPPGWQG